MSLDSAIVLHGPDGFRHSYERWLKDAQARNRTNKIPRKELQCRGPHIHFGLGRKWPKNGFGRHLDNGGAMARTMGKWPEIPFFEPLSRQFFPFSGPFPPHCPGEAKIHFLAIFVLISGRRPAMDLYEVHGVARKGGTIML